MIHVDREMDMTAQRHHKRKTQMLKDERLDERKPFNVPSEYKHAIRYLTLLDPLKTDSTDETKALMVWTPSMQTNLI